MPEPASPQPMPAADAPNGQRNLGRNNIIAGAAWMVTAGVFFSVMAGLIRHLSAEMHPFQIAFLRNVAGLVFMLPWLAHVGFGGLKTRRFGLYTIRGVTSLIAMLCFFSAITLMPLAEATALAYTTPFFATILAILFLGEIVRARRWTAIAIGFIGALVIIRPGGGLFGYPALLVLMSSLAMASSVIVVRRLAATESANAIVTYMVIYLVPLSLAPALFVWRDPGWTEIGLAAVIGLCGTGGHLCYTRALREAEASAVMPFDFSKLIFTAIVGYVAFGQLSDIWTWVGAAIILAAAAYIAHREVAAGRRQPPPVARVEADRY